MNDPKYLRAPTALAGKSVALQPKLSPVPLFRMTAATLPVGSLRLLASTPLAPPPEDSEIRTPLARNARAFIAATLMA